MRCINPNCGYGGAAEVRFTRQGYAHVVCLCGCAGPTVAHFDVTMAESYNVTREKMEARARELWTDLLHRMEPGRVLGEAAKELREREEVRHVG